MTDALSVPFSPLRERRLSVPGYSMTLPRAFLLAVAAGFAGVLGLVLFDKMQSRAPVAAPVAPPTVHGLLDQVAVREQIALADIVTIKAGGYRTLIDLRPDGEAADQPASAVVGEAARAAGLRFAYVPTPHGDIPDAVVDGLSTALCTSRPPSEIRLRFRVT